MSPQAHASFFNRLLFVLVSIFAASVSWADPQISDVRSSSTQLTIVGTGFSHADAIPEVYDTVEGEQYSQLAEGDAITENLGVWSQTNHYGNPLQITRSGDLRTDGATAAYSGHTKSYVGWPRSMANTTTKSLYVSWWYKPNKMADKGGSNKYIRIWDDANGKGTRISWTQMHLTYNAKDIGVAPPSSWSTTQPKPGQWNRFEIYVDAQSRTIRAMLNGEVRHNLTNFTKSPQSRGLNVALIGFDPSIDSNYSDLSFRMQDIYVSKSQARVEISDSAEWNPKSSREIVRPTSWGDTEIVVELTPAAMSRLARRYVYVIDSDGTVNQRGYLISGDLPAAPTPPKPPTIVQNS